MAGVTGILRKSLRNAQQEALSVYEDCSVIDRGYAQSSEVLDTEWAMQAVDRAILALLDAKLEIRLINAGYYPNIKTGEGV